MLLDPLRALVRTLGTLHSLKKVVEYLRAHAVRDNDRLLAIEQRGELDGGFESRKVSVARFEVLDGETPVVGREVHRIGIVAEHGQVLPKRQHRIQSAWMPTSI